MTHGFCPHCKRFMRLKKDGTLRHHGGAVGSGVWSDYRSYCCKGVGQVPALLLTGRTMHGVEVTGALVQIVDVRHVVLRTQDSGDHQVQTATVVPAAEAGPDRRSIVTVELPGGAS